MAVQMTIQQFRFLARVLMGQVSPEEHFHRPGEGREQGRGWHTSRVCRDNGWLLFDQEVTGGSYVTQTGLDAMRAVFPEYFYTTDELKREVG